VGNILVESAINGLRLVGINVPQSAENFIEMLINEGVDVVDEVPKIVSFVEQLGGEAWHLITQVTEGMEQYGPVGYTEHLIRHVYDPHYQTIKDIHQQKMVMLDAHRSTLSTFHTKAQALYNGQQAFSGQGATSAQTQLNTLNTGMSSHLALLETSLTYDHHFFNQYDDAIKNLETMAIIALIIVCLLLLILIIAIVASGGGALALIGLGGSAAAGGTIALGGTAAAGGLSLGATIGLAALASIDTLILHWALQHEGLAQPLTLNWNPAGTTTTTHTALISAGPTLPNPNAKGSGETPAEAALIDELLNEFGGAIPRDVLKYLVKWLGASQLTAAMIRCLYQNGYLNLPSKTYGSDPLESNYESAWNAIASHFDPNDLEGAWKEVNPDQVDPTTINPDSNYVSNADHVREVRDGLKSIQKVLTSLEKKLTYLDRIISGSSDPNTPEILDLITQKTHIQKLKDAFTALQKYVQSKIQRNSPSPDTWPDKGRTPILEDLLQVSTCKVPGSQYYKPTPPTS